MFPPLFFFAYAFRCRSDVSSLVAKVSAWNSGSVCKINGSSFFAPSCSDSPLTFPTFHACHLFLRVNYEAAQTSQISTSNHPSASPESPQHTCCQHTSATDGQVSKPLPRFELMPVSCAKSHRLAVPCNMSNWPLGTLMSAPGICEDARIESSRTMGPWKCASVEVCTEKSK